MELANELGSVLYGMTPSEAIEQGVCIRCKKPPVFYSKAGEDEYQMTGMCEPCWDEEFGEFE